MTGESLGVADGGGPPLRVWRGSGSLLVARGEALRQRWLPAGPESNLWLGGTASRALPEIHDAANGLRKSPRLKGRDVGHPAECTSA
jgi:hypothetical protein